MTRARLACLFLLPLVFLAGCDVFGSEDAAEVQERLYPVVVDGRWGYINAEGRIVITPPFDQADDFSDDRAAALVGPDWGSLYASGPPAVAPQHPVASAFADDSAPAPWVRMGTQSGL